MNGLTDTTFSSGITVQLSPENASDGTLLAVRALSDHELDIVTNTAIALYQK